MGGEVDEMNGPRGRLLHQNESFVPTYDEGVPDSHHASQLEAQHADDYLNLSYTGHWVEDGHLKHKQQGQCGELRSHSMQYVPSNAANYRVGCVQEYAMFGVSECHAARGTTTHGCNPPMQVPNLYWHQEEESSHQKFSPFYLRQQPEVGIGTTLHHQHRNGSTNEFVQEPSAAAKNETWAACNTFEGSQYTHPAKQMQIVVDLNASDATCSRFTHHDPNWVYRDHDVLETSVSNPLPEYCLRPLQSSASSHRVNVPTSSGPTSFKSPSHRNFVPGSKPLPRNRRRNRISTSSNTGGYRDVYISHQGPHLAPPMQRRVSSASSQMTEATSSSAISDHTPKVLRCMHCEAVFTGKFRKGNRRRHERAKHCNKTPIECESCGKCFGRSDALQKHIRKQHLTE